MVATGAIAILIALLLRPGAVGFEPDASTDAASTTQPSPAVPGVDPIPAVSLRSDVTGTAREVLEGILLADVDESRIVGGEWVLVSGGATWTSTKLAGPSSTIRTTGRVVAATTRLEGRWTAGLVDALTGDYRPIYELKEPGDWWIQASADPAAETLVVVGSGTAGSSPLDLGVLVVRIADGRTTTLTPDAKTRGFRSELEWSASGRTVASSDCDMDVCRVDIVHPEEGTLVSIEDLSPLAIGDDAVLGVQKSKDFLWRSVDVETGTRTVVPGSRIAGAFDGYESTPGVFVISGRTADGGFAIEVFDAKAGATRLVYERATDDVYLYPLSSNPGWATIGGRGGLVDIIVGREGLDLLDLDSGNVVTDALKVTWGEAESPTGS